MRINWVIEPSCWPECTESMQQALLNFPKHTLTILDGTDYTKPLPVVEGPVVVHGPLQLLHQGYYNPDWNPGIICNLDNFLWTNYAKHYTKHLLNRDWGISSLADLRDDAREGLLQPCFVRPDAGDKPFPGTVISGDKILYFATIQELIRHSGIASVPVIVSSLKEDIGGEYRVVIINRRVITGCMYKNQGEIQYQSGYPTAVKELAEYMANHWWQPDFAYVVDIAIVPEGARIIEINSFSCADWYASNHTGIIYSMEQFIEECRH